MFKRENRLVPGVRFNNSHILTVAQFTLKNKKNNLNLNRFGIVVSKKVDARAVGRNKIKRFFRTALVNLNEKISLGHDILFVVKKEVLNKSEEENLLAVNNALEKTGLLKS
jgi:ribonuclease P protein component